MLIGLLGRLGKGKTLGMTYLLARMAANSKNKHITMTNYAVQFADVVEKNPSNFIDNSEKFTGFQGIDEAWSWADSRKSGENFDINEMVLNSRKRGWTVIYTTQFAHQVDKRIRDNTDYWVLCEHIENAVVIDGEAKDVAMLHVFDAAFEFVKTIRYIANKFYGMYDTREEISTRSKKEQYGDIIKDYAEKWDEGTIDTKKSLTTTIHLEESISKSDSAYLADYIAENTAKILTGEF